METAIKERINKAKESCQRRRWISTELTQSEEEKFRAYLKANGYTFETSGCGNLVHFEVYADFEETQKANAFLDTL